MRRLPAALLLLVAAWTTNSPGAAAGGDGPPAFVGSLRQFTLLDPPQPAPLTPIADGADRTLDLSRFRGRVVLVNFWATWCVPCVAEMPSLDKLQAKLGGDDFAVVALSIDEGGLAAVQPFYARLGLENLGIYLDRNRTAAALFKLRGLPVSYLLDRDGRIVGYLVGAADWDSPEAEALIRYYIAQGKGRAG